MENCPYCNSEIEINHDDGYGYQEDEVNVQYCSNCSNYFRYTTSIIYYYELDELPCRNGAEHKLKEIHGHPKEFFKYKRICEYCDEEFIINDSEHKKSCEEYFDRISK